MKTYKDYLIDFDTLKVGQEVWSIHLGVCKIVSLSNNRVYVTNNRGDHYYTCNGKIHIVDESFSLFKEKPDFFKEKKEIKRWKWYFEFINNYGQEDSDISKQLTEEQFKTCFKKILSENRMIKYEKIDCTEITDVVYE